MSILQEARQLCESANLPMKNNKMDVDEYIRVWDARKALLNMVPEVLAYAERREMQAIEARGQIIQYHRGILYPLDRSIDFWNGMPKEEKKICCEQAAKELSADLSSWHKITEEEKAAIKGILSGIECDDCYFTEADIEVLRGLIL